MSKGRAAIRVYELALHLYPRRFRDEYGPDKVLLVREQLADEPVVPVLVRSVIDLAIAVPTQHLEAHMKAPRRLVPLLFLGIALAGLGVAALGGTEPMAVAIGLILAVGAGVVGLSAWRQVTPVAHAGVTAGWWKFLLAGPVLLAAVVLAAGAGVEAWFVGMAVVLTAVVCILGGIGLGIAHLVKSRTHLGPA